METIIKLPPINLDHLRTLTNNTGIIEHSKFSIPNRKEGYTTDDNARALVDVLKYNEVHRASQLALIAFNWFFGKNLPGVILYDQTTGGYFDRINPEGSN